MFEHDSEKAHTGRHETQFPTSEMIYSLDMCVDTMFHPEFYMEMLLT